MFLRAQLTDILRDSKLDRLEKNFILYRSTKAYMHFTFKKKPLLNKFLKQSLKVRVMGHER